MTGLFDRLAGRARGADTGAVRPLVTHPMLDDGPARPAGIDEREDAPAARDDELDARTAPPPAPARRAAPQIARFAGDRPLVPPVLDRGRHHGAPDDRRTPEGSDLPVATGGSAPPGPTPPASVAIARRQERVGPTAESDPPGSAASSLPPRLADPDAGATAWIAPPREDRPPRAAAPAARQAPRSPRPAAGPPAAAWSDPPLVPEELVRQPALVPRAPAVRIAGDPAAVRPVVKVTIGRVEVRAVSPPAPAPRRSPPRRDAPSLSDYLARRDRGDPRGER